MVRVRRQHQLRDERARVRRRRRVRDEPREPQPAVHGSRRVILARLRCDRNVRNDKALARMGRRRTSAASAITRRLETRIFLRSAARAMRRASSTSSASSSGSLARFTSSFRFLGMKTPYAEQAWRRVPVSMLSTSTTTRSSIEVLYAHPTDAVSTTSEPSVMLWRC